ncbi:hypothetical protein K6119_15855 [Paracrocinitomix mangrovi]|uniref:hypothetical protein n=1 Tax=Paracrocinitomix mangrovi TaxID=2862509 RepID=UPI001C8E2184|nr:hypothetical protein [Paracrocinitomix mangrovi]UKN01205.1 hypothetical protein K6119_15855 [Paracrocinitomix mangrovi]
MKSLISTLLSLIITGAAIAQIPSFDWKNLRTSPAGSSFEYFIGEDDGFYYFMSNKGPQGTTKHITKVNKELTTYDVIPVKSQYGLYGGDPFFEKSFVIDGTIYQCHETWDREAKKRALTLVVIDETGMITEFKRIAEHEYSKVFFPGEFSYSLSPDKKKLLMIRIDAFRKKSPTTEIEIMCYNTSDWSLIYSELKTLDHPSQKVPRYQSAIDNEGNVVFGNKFELEKEWVNRFYAFNAASKELKTFDVGFENKKNVYHYDILTHGNGNFTFIGTYNDKNVIPTAISYGGAIMGHFMIDIENASTIKTKTFELINDQVLSHFHSKPEELNNRSLDHFALRETYKLSNGNYVMVMESESSSKKNIGTTEKLIWQYTYKRGAILTFGIDGKTGKMMWSNKISKGQVETLIEGEPINYIGFNHFLKDDQVYIIYNNQAASSQWKETDGQTYQCKQTFGNTTDIPPFMYAIQADGEVKYGDLALGLPLKTIFNSEKDFPIKLNSRLTIRTEYGLLLLAEYGKGSKYKLGKLYFND